MVAKAYKVMAEGLGMSWHYAACKRESCEFDVAEEVYELVEVFHMDDDVAHTKEPVSVWGSSREDLANRLRQAADDVMMYDVIDETGGKQ